MTNERCVNVDPEALRTQECVIVKGVEINIGLSPYDIPEQVCCFYDDDLEKLVIKLKYLDDEEQRKSSKQTEHISFLVGKFSECLYEIQIDVHGLEADAVELKLWLPKVSDEILKMAADKGRADRKWHYEVVNEAIEKGEKELLAAN